MKLKGKGKLAAALAALVVAAGFVSGAGASEINPQTVDVSEPPAIVAEGALPQEPDFSVGETQSAVHKKFRKRGAFLVLPASIIGSVLKWLLSLAWKGLLSPVLSTAAGWALTALVVLAAVCLGLKAAFPGTPLKEILTKTNVKRILILAFLACGFFDLLKLGWPELEKAENIAQAVICVALSAYAVYRICRKHAKKAERI